MKASDGGGPAAADFAWTKEAKAKACMAAQLLFASDDQVVEKNASSNPEAGITIDDVVLVAFDPAEKQVVTMRACEESALTILAQDLQEENYLSLSAGEKTDCEKVQKLFLEQILWSPEKQNSSPSSSNGSHTQAKSFSKYVLGSFLVNRSEKVAVSSKTLFRLGLNRLRFSVFSTLPNTSPSAAGTQALCDDGPSRKRQKNKDDCSVEAGQVAFLRSALQLKRQKRTGWILRNVREPESVADHSFGVALCALLIRDTEIDWKKACIMGLVHDLAESLVGDLTPGMVTQDAKHRLEQKAMEKLLALLGSTSDVAKELEALWKEYELRKSPEARLVKDLDRFEMVLQADMYERAGDSSQSLEEFFESVRGKIAHPVVAKWHDALVSGRPSTLSAKLEPKK